MVEGAFRSLARTALDVLHNRDIRLVEENILSVVIAQGQELGLKIGLRNGAIYFSYPASGPDQKKLMKPLVEDLRFQHFMASLFFVYKRYERAGDDNSARSVKSILSELASLVYQVVKFDQIKFSDDPQDFIVSPFWDPGVDIQNQVVLSYYLTPDQKTKLDRL